MRRRTQPRKISIPEKLGNGGCDVWPYILGLIFNALLHISLFIFYGLFLHNFLYLSVSFIFFIYPFSYVTDILWSLRPSVCSVLAGQTLINRKYYMNTVRKNINYGELLPVTVSIPVYTEANEVIFETIRSSIAAVKKYQEYSYQAGNVIVSDDGIAVMLGGFCTEEKVERLLERFFQDAPELSAQERKAAQRICFYREQQVPFVVRPAKNRAGLFKKASNLNYTLRLGEAIYQGKGRKELTKPGAEFEYGYAEGNIYTNEMILLLDKDSGVKEKIIEAIAPEFSADDKLAYVQCATHAVNVSDNYYTYATGHQVNNLFLNIWPCKALQGFFVPLVGHNVFLRKSILEKSRLWSEDKVSEDYDKAICFYNMGYHGKYAQIQGLEFTEYVSRTFAEESSKQLRYSYGLFEMIFDGTIVWGKSRKCDVLYMLLYFCSVINEVMLLPTVLLESYFGNIHLLWAGFLLCNFCFIVLPCIRGRIMKRHFPKEQTEKIMHTVIIAVSFVGHSFAMLSGACRYVVNLFKTNQKAFPSSSVDKLEYHFSDGVKLIVEYIKKNKGFIPIAILCLDRGLFMITRKGIEPVTMFTYCYVLFGTVLVPILMTPQFFSGAKKKENVKMARQGQKREIASIPLPLTEWSTEMQKPEAEVKLQVESLDSDIRSFLDNYHQTLQEIMSDEKMPPELTVEYSFESCIRKDDQNKKEIYLLKRITDDTKAILKITKDYPEEDAWEEAELLKKLDHPGIPKVYRSYELGGRRYIVREYIEGRTLYDIVKINGLLSPNDIFHVVLKLTEILRYLHQQMPPVIHRDIKPQNIIVGKDGKIHLIDFGIARVHKEGRTQDTSVVLTLDYAPPEQYGFDQTSALTDIYSLGIVMLFMATGHTTRTELEAQIINNRLCRLIERCIAFDPKSRIQSVEEIREYILRENYARKKYRGVVVAAAVVFLCAGLSALAYGLGMQHGKRQGEKSGYENGHGIGYTDGYETVPVFQIGEGEALIGGGNLPGNLTVGSGAYAVQNEAGIYYILEKDIYKVPKGSTIPQLFLKDAGAQGLSSNHGWLYYSAGDDIMQTNLYSLKTEVLSQKLTAHLLIDGDNYYALGKEALYLLNVRDGRQVKLADVKGYQNINLYQGRLYFTAGEESKLYSSKLNGEDIRLLTEDSCSSACVYQDAIYCCVQRAGFSELIKIGIPSGEEQSIAEESAGLLNVTGRGIYFIDTIDGTINFCTLDGRLKSVISTNAASDFNLAGDLIFYHNQGDGNKLWCVGADGTDDHPVRARR